MPEHRIQNRPRWIGRRTAGLLSAIGIFTAPKRIRTLPCSTVMASVVSSRCAGAVLPALIAKTRVLLCKRVPSAWARSATGSKEMRGVFMASIFPSSAAAGYSNVSGELL